MGYETKDESNQNEWIPFLFLGGKDEIPRNLSDCSLTLFIGTKSFSSSLIRTMSVTIMDFSFSQKFRIA